MSILNLIVASSNIPAVYPLYVSLLHSDYLTFGAIAFVSTFSFLSHLFENHKHGMNGIKFVTTSKSFSYILNRLDVLGCILTAMRYIQIIIELDGLFIDKINKIFLTQPALLSMMFTGLTLNMVSEHDKYNPKLRTFYVITHSFWHLIAFTSMGVLLTYIYSF